MTNLVLPSVPNAVYHSSQPISIPSQSQIQQHQQRSYASAPQHTVTPGSSSSSSPPNIFMPKRPAHTPSTARQRKPLSYLSSDELAQQDHAIQVELLQLDENESRRSDLERHLGLIHAELELRSKPAQNPSPSTSARVVMLSPQEVNAIDQHHADWSLSHQPQLSDYAPTPPATPSKRRVIRRARSKGTFQDIIGWADSLDRSGSSTPKSSIRTANKSAYNLARPSWWSEAMGVDPSTEDAEEVETDEFGRALEEEYLEDDDTLLRQVEDHRA